MKPILTNSEIRKLDVLTIEQEPIASIDLMERASKAFCSALLERVSFTSVTIFCGPGNNGGDGLAIARILHELGKEVAVVVPLASTKCSKDHKINSERLESLPIQTLPMDKLRDLPQCDLAIDALFGSGLDREIQGVYLRAVETLNSLNAVVVSVDIPSGMTDIPEGVKVAVNADHTISFQYPKLSMLMPSAKGICESFQLVDIGLIEYGGESELLFIEEQDITAFLPIHSKYSHKYDKGGVLLVGGSRGMAGSIILSSEAALRTGSGLVHSLVDEDVVDVGTVRVPEVMFHSNRDISVKELLPKLKAIGIGPGLGFDDSKLEFLKLALNSELTSVLDADAIRLAAREKLSVEGSVLTPHEGEFKELVGSWNSEIEKLEKLKSYSQKNKCVVVLKGAHTVISDGEKCYFNPIGNPAMATAGSGDVLLGIISSFVSQGCSATEAACAGVYVHALASLIYLNDNQSVTLISSDIVAKIGTALVNLS